MTALIQACLTISTPASAEDKSFKKPPTEPQNPTLVRVSPVSMLAMPGTGSFSIDELLPQEYTYPDVGVNIGQGWNTYLGQPTNAVCVTGTTAPLGISYNNVRFTDVSDREEMMSSMRVSAKASFGVIASGKGDFSRTATLDRSRRNIMATVDILQDGQMLKGIAATKDGLETIELTPAALAILNSTPPEDAMKKFTRACGDTYVTAIHSGAKLNALFSIEHSQESLKTSYSMSAKGSYGMFSGSVAAALSTATTTAADKVSFEQVHWGGPTGIAQTPAEMLTRINTFATASGPVRPFRLYARSYRHASNWPQKLAYVPLTSVDVARLAGQSWRFKDLADLYAEAATAPNHFYFPYSKGANIEVFTEHAAKRSDILQGASQCIQNIAMFCALEPSCNLTEMFKKETLPKTCPALVDAKEDFAVALLDLLVGPELADGLLDSATAKVAHPGTKSIYAREKLPFESNNLPADIYYQYLAQAPLRRSTGPEGRNTRDETTRLELFIEQEGLSVAKGTYPDFAKNEYTAEELKPVTRAFQSWIVRTKLMPISQALCTDASHPMCRSVTQLTMAADTPVALGKERNFIADPTKPAPIPSPPKVDPPPKPPHDCFAIGLLKPSYPCP